MPAKVGSKALFAFLSQYTPQPMGRLTSSEVHYNTQMILVDIALVVPDYKGVGFEG